MPKVEIEFFTSVAYQTNSTMTRLIVLGGTADRCKLRLQNKSISAIHFALVLMQDGLWVADLAGKTGAFVNNRTAHFARIGDGDELQVGTFRLRARYTGDNLGDSASVIDIPQSEQPPSISTLPAPHLPVETFLSEERTLLDEGLQELEAQRAELEGQRTELEVQRAELGAQRKQLAVQADQIAEGQRAVDAAAGKSRILDEMPSKPARASSPSSVNSPAGKRKLSPHSVRNSKGIAANSRPSARHSRPIAPRSKRDERLSTKNSGPWLPCGNNWTTSLTQRSSSIGPGLS